MVFYSLSCSFTSSCDNPNRTMDVIVGTAGHIDHGKTALVRALTGTDTDRLPEEKKRGITIDLGFAELETGGVHFGFVDVPGHERFVKNMLAGASGIDMVMLVIAADESVMPQTREHFEICRLLNVESGIVVLTKSDLVSEEILDLVRIEAAELVEGSFLEDAPVIPFSSKTNEGSEALHRALANSAGNLQQRRDEMIPRLSVDRSFTKKGFGAVITGTLASGEVNEGQELDLFPGPRPVRVRGLQTHGRSVKMAHRGQRTAINLAGVDHSEIERGMFLAEKHVLRETQSVDARVEVLPDAKRPLRSRHRVRVHIGAAEILSRVVVLNERGEIEPGKTGFVQLRLETPVVTIVGERFVVRSYSPQVTVAGGIILEPFASRHRRKDLAPTSQYLRKMAESIGDPEILLLNFIKRAAEKGISRFEVQARTGWQTGVLGKAITCLVERGDVLVIGDILIGKHHLDELAAKVLKAVEVFHKYQPLAAGITREALRNTTFGGIPETIFYNVTGQLESKNLVVVEGEIFRLQGRTDQLTDVERAAKEQMRRVYSEARLEPPKLDEVLAASAKLGRDHARRVFQLLVNSGEVVKVTDEFYFTSNAINDLATNMRSMAESSGDRSIDVAGFKDLAGVSRKYAIPLLEYFDREKVTVRSGDKRLILK